MKFCFTNLFVTLQIVLVALSININKVLFVLENILCDVLWDWNLSMKFKENIYICLR